MTPVDRRPPINDDAEIKAIDGDRLDRETFARRVADRIDRAGQSPSVVFGLSGPWGSGKTSVLNMIAEVLGKNDAWHVAHFTPWAATDVSSVTEEFYSAIASAMPEGKGTTAKALLLAAVPVGAVALKALAAAGIERYFPGLIAKVGTATSDKIADTAGNYSVDPEPFQARFNNISEAIAAARVNILVVVDDLDRLHADELLAVMKAVRLLGRFPRVHYLLSYDEKTVLDVLMTSDLASGNRDRARRYMEKIVQYPFLLPPLQRTQLERELAERMAAVAEVHGHTLSETEQSGYNGNIIEEFLDVVPRPSDMTLRTVNQLCSQTDILLTLVGSDELNFLDAMLVTHLRLTYFDLYEILPSWRSQLLSRTKTKSSNEWLNQIGDAVGLEKGHPLLGKLYKLLGALFPLLPHLSGFVWSERPAPKQVSDDLYFDRYFMFTIPVGDIQDSAIIDALQVLLDTGSLAPDSLITQCLEDNRKQRLGRKLHSATSIIDAPAESSARAAISLTQHLSPSLDNPLSTLWKEIVYGILVNSVAAAADEIQRREIITKYRASCGFEVTVDILASRRFLPNVEASKIVESSQDLRAEVLEACIRDLTGDVEPRHGILALVHYFDGHMWSELHDRVTTLGLTVLDVATRFVGISDLPNGAKLGRFEDEYFQHLYSLYEIDSHTGAPSIKAELTAQIMPYVGSVIDMTDVSLGGRRILAATEIWKVTQ